MHSVFRSLGRITHAMSNTMIDTSRPNQYQVTQQPETSKDNKYPYEPTTTPKSRSDHHSSTSRSITELCDCLAACFCCLCLCSICNSDSDGCDCDGCDCDGCDCNGCDC
jgi:hypothetical protein